MPPARFPRLKFGGWAVVGLLFAALPGVKDAAASPVRIILGGHSYGQSGLPSPGFSSSVQPLASIGADAYVSGGDITESGSAAEWDSVFALVDSAWAFPFYPTMGNHDAFDRPEWTARFGPSYYAADIGSVRLLVLDDVGRPNDSLEPAQQQWFLAQLDSAQADTSVSVVLVAKHKLSWLKTRERYEDMYRLANGWAFEFSFAGYDVGSFQEEVWPALAGAAAQKPVVLFSGDIGTSAGTPSVFYDTLDGVVLLACGTALSAKPDADAFLIMDVLDDSVAVQTFSPWGTGLASPETYDPAYWNAFFNSGTQFFTPPPPGPTTSEIIFVEGATYEHGDHYALTNNAYSGFTGYTVTYSDFYLHSREVTVRDYLAYLNDAGANEYAGVECIDLDDPEAQIRFTGVIYQAKSPMLLDQPVVEVTWYGALGYCNFLSSQSGMSPAYSGTVWDPNATGWRLPTEAEFEAAMRGGVGFTPGSTVYHRFPWAPVDEDSIGNYANYLGTGLADTYPGLAEVGSFPPNRWGFFDLSGNAFEWVYDPWTWPWELSGAVSDPVAPGSAGMEGWRAVRGGGVGYHWLGCRSAYRTAEPDTSSQGYLGFRVARNYSGVVGLDPAIPPGGILSPAFPNPSGSSRTTLRFTLALPAADVSIRVYDPAGRLVRVLREGPAAAGSAEVRWDGRNSKGQRVGAGVYQVVLVADGTREHTRITLLR